MCGGDHSIFHCENRCGVCHGDSRQSLCNECPPQKRKETPKSTAYRCVTRRSKEKVRVTAKGLQKSGSGLPQEDPPASEQQHQQTAEIHISTHSLANIHEWYDLVLQTMKENRCSMACSFRLAGCPRSTLRDFMAIAELKKVNSREQDLIFRDQGATSVRDLEVAYCKRLQRYIPVMTNRRREGQLLPMKFEARFYEWSILYISRLTKRLL